MKSIQLVTHIMRQVALAAVLIVTANSASAMMLNFHHYSKFDDRSSVFSGKTSGNWASTHWQQPKQQFNKADLDGIFSYGVNSLLDNFFPAKLDKKIELIDSLWGFDFADACSSFFENKCNSISHDEAVTWLEELAADFSSYEHIADLIELGLDYFAEHCPPGTEEPAPVPVPASIWLFASALLGFNLIGRKKQ